MAFMRNVGRDAEHVKIILEDGTPTWVRVMPRNKGVTLPEGATVCPRWNVQYGQNIRHFESNSPAWSTNVRQPEPEPAPTAAPEEIKGGE